MQIISNNTDKVQGCIELRLWLLMLIEHTSPRVGVKKLTNLRDDMNRSLSKRNILKGY